MRRLRSIIVVSLILCSASVTFGQSFSGDARRIGMGGVGDASDIASKMVEPRRPYRSVVIPLGLIQVYKDRHFFNPDDDRFNPVLLLEDIANPLHLTANRGTDDQGFVEDLIDARLNRDLNAYRGFVPEKQIVAEGLASPRYGHMFRVKGDSDKEPYQGFYLGAGPYLSVQTTLNVDDQLRQILSSSTDVYRPNQSFLITDQTLGQAALGVTAGYRGRISLADLSNVTDTDRNGLYIASNYHYLRGFRHDSADIQVRFDTDSQGRVTLAPTTVPLTVLHPYSSSGQGFALDLGVATVLDEWQVGFGATGIANRITWKDMSLERFTLRSLVDGGDFVEQDLTPLSSETRVELPVTYSGNVGYDNGTWAALGELSHGFQGTSLHMGAERHFGPIDLRGGVHDAQDRWHPTAGAGLNVTRRFGVDVAVFDTTANIVRERKPAFAVSLRFNQSPDEFD
jgi:hypothetical protein